MDNNFYKKKLEEKLIREFLIKFQQKIGYKPIIITSSGITSDAVIILKLNELENYFTPFLPVYGGEVLNLKSKNRLRNLVELRAIFFFIARGMGYSLYSLGTYMGGRDHSTVLHNLRLFRDLYQVDEVFKEKYNLIFNSIKKTYESPTLEYIDKVELES